MELFAVTSNRSVCTRSSVAGMMGGLLPVSHMDIYVYIAALGRQMLWLLLCGSSSLLAGLKDNAALYLPMLHENVIL